jgi:hypothetical protein
MGVALCAMAGAASQVAFAADEGLIRARVAVSNNNYSIDFDQNDPNYKNRSAKSSFAMRGIGLTAVSSGGVYLDFLTQSSGTATHDLWNTPMSPWTTAPHKDLPFKRTENTLTLGFSNQVGEGAGSFFLGYKQGKSELDSPYGKVDFTGTWKRDEFTSAGMFFGGGFAFPAIGGQIGLNAALALMKGKWTDDTGYNNEADITVGFSFGASYTYMFTGNFGASLDFKGAAYNYNFNTSTNNPYTISEKIGSVGVNLLAQF